MLYSEMLGEEGKATMKSLTPVITSAVQKDSKASAVHTGGGQVCVSQRHVSILPNYLPKCM